jgi:hypothetical protein
MTTRPDDVPPHAEELSVFDYVKTHRLPSRYIKGAEQLIPVFICPGCTEKREMPFKVMHCSCGLSMRAGVTGLWIWPSKMRVVA